MAKGTLNNVTAPGTITVTEDTSNRLALGSSIDFDVLNGTFQQNDLVIFQIDDSDPARFLAYDVKLDPIDLDFPDNAKYPGAQIIIAPQVGDLIVDAQVVIVQGTTITGNITITNGGTLILKSTTQDGAVRAKVIGSIDSNKQNATLTIYKSDITGDVTIKDSTQKVKIITGSTGGDVLMRNVASVKILTGSTGGDVLGRQNGTLFIDGLVVTNRDLTVKDNTLNTTVINCLVQKGDILIKDNVGCTHKGNTAPMGSVNISGCTLIP